ncbi:MAG: sulfatase-like hydrolase/transferase, partial [Luteolibacter sp.]
MKFGNACFSIVLTLIPVMSLQTTRAAQDPAPPNVLLIYVDDMGYGDLGCYGSETLTPNIDELATEGIRFTNYLSASSVCSPSRGAVLTGRYPQRNGLPVCPNGNGKDPEWDEHVGLPLGEITIAELLKPKGYATAAFGKWHLGEPAPYGPLKQGFDEYEGTLYNFPVGKPSVWLHGEEPQDKIMFNQAHQRLTDATVGFMKRQQAEGKPFFIYLAHYLVHGPWSPNKEFCTSEEWATVVKKKGAMNPNALPAMVRELDHHVGLVLDQLKELGLDKDTIVIFASDNGPWLPAGSAEPFSEGKYSTKEGGQRVPAIIRWPDHIPAGQVSDEMVSSLDLLPTIASATGTSLPEDRKYDGFDLMPLLSGSIEESPRKEFLYYNGLT